MASSLGSCRIALVDTTPGLTAMELNRESLQSSFDLISETLGASWIRRKLKEEIAQQELARERKDDRRNLHLFRKPPHPLIEWWTLSQRWKDSLQVEDPPQYAFRIAHFAEALRLAISTEGFEKLVPRLKSKSEYFSAAFEAHVAASYVSRGYSVKFIPETASRTPDLYIERPDGTTFWAECKSRDALSDAEEETFGIWRDLQAALMREFSTRRKNVLIAIKCDGRPARNEVNALISFILSILESQTAPRTFPQVCAELIAPIDEAFEAASFGVSSSEEFGQFTASVECTPQPDGKMLFKNPSHYAFKCTDESDKVYGVVASLKSAVPQLPESGPGVVHVKLSDGSWGKDFQDYFDRVRKELERELSGNQNRRVNAAIVHANSFEIAETKTVGFQSIQFIVEHSNPRASG